jgi:hypothetical protein
MRLRRSDPLGPWIDDVPAGQERIAPADLAWLRALPEEIVLTDGVYVCHGMPGNSWNSIWPRHPHYDGNVSDLDRDASLQMLARLNISLALCGHVPQPWEHRDRLPDGRDVHVVRAGSRADNRVGFAVVTQRPDGWEASWGDAEYLPRHR